MKKTLSTMILVVFLANVALTQVKYQEGSLVLNGIQLLQDSHDPLAFYYLPPSPRISMKKDSSYDFLFIKYVGGREDQNGAIFHVLLDYTLPQEMIDLNDLAYQQREVFIGVDGQLAKAFDQMVNNVTVSLKKSHADGTETQDQRLVRRDSLGEGTTSFVYANRKDDDRAS